MPRVSLTDVREAYTRAVFWAGKAGLDTTNWQLREASGPVGFKLILPRFPTFLPGIGGDDLGRTPGEALQSLSYLTAAWRMVAEWTEVKA